MKKLLLIFIGLLGVLTIVIMLLNALKPIQITQFPLAQPTPTGVPPPAISFHSINYHEIFPDPQTAQKIGDTLQNPISTETQGNYIVGHFASDAATFSTDVYQQKGFATFLIQTFDTDNTYYSDFVLLHSGDETETLYDPSHAGGGFMWKIYPTDGVAFFTNPDSGYTGRMLYFRPTSYDNFLQTTAPTLGITTTDPASQASTVEKGE